MKYNLLALFLLLLLIPAAVAQDTIVARDLEIDLGGDFVTKAQITYPAEGEGPFPTVILFHGSGPYDMDSTYFTVFGEEPLSANFKLIADRLAEAGIAVLRFNKRGVLGDGQYDFAQVQTSSLDRLVADADAVINAALEQPEVDASQLYLYGWSEGTWVVTNAAANRPDAVAGLILQAAPLGDLSTVLSYQHLENGLPFLAEEIDTDGDGLLSLEEIATVPAGYPVSLMPAFYMYAPTSTPTDPQVNSLTDTNQDGLIDIEGELRPIIETFIAQYPTFLNGIEASYDIPEILAELEIPTLILHGEADGWVPVTAGEAIAEAVPDVVTLNTYSGLGHALSPVESAVADVFVVMDDQPIDDTIAWISGE